MKPQNNAILFTLLVANRTRSYVQSPIAHVHSCSFSCQRTQYCSSLHVPFLYWKRGKTRYIMTGRAIRTASIWCDKWVLLPSECGKGLGRGAVTAGGIAHLLEGWSDLGDNSCWTLCQARSLINSSSSLFMSTSATQRKNYSIEIRGKLLFLLGKILFYSILFYFQLMLKSYLNHLEPRSWCSCISCL